MAPMREGGADGSRPRRSEESHVDQGTPEPSVPAGSGGVGAPLAALAVAIVVFMQIGTFARPLGDVGGTRAADWLDLLTPWAVLGSAAWVLLRSRALTRGRAPDSWAWVALAVGGVAFAEGKGLHLAANSIGNTEPSPPAADLAHLWDETVGHWLWYVGLVLVLVGVTRTLLGSPEGAPPLRATLPGVALAVLTGFSLANTWIEGATPWLGIAAAGGFVVHALVHRRPATLLWLVCFGLALVQVVGWGLYWWVAEGLVFPEYYEVFGWL